MKNPNRFYTYAYLREDKTPYYIGKGKGNRVYAKHHKGISVPKDKKRIIFLKQNLTEEQAFIHEKYMIFVFGRKDLETGILRNLSDGGEGNSGLIHNEETKRKISEAVKGKNHPLYGISPSEETKKKMSNSLKGRIISSEWREKMSKSHTGKPATYGFNGKSHSEETKQKLRKINLGRTHSEETKRKISLLNGGVNHYQYGNTLSEETKQKLKELNIGENNPNYGKHWWNNGYISKLSIECPGDNWTLGRIMKSKGGD
jgi:hypothetical protein